MGLRWSVVLCLFTVSVMIGANAYAADVENIVRNGDFEEGIIEWELRQNPGNVAQMREDRVLPVRLPQPLCLAKEVQ